MKRYLSVRLAVSLLVLLAFPQHLLFRPRSLFPLICHHFHQRQSEHVGQGVFLHAQDADGYEQCGQWQAAGPIGGKMGMIVDGTTKTMYMLMTEQRMYMEFPTDQDGPMTQNMPKFEDMFKGNDPCAGREGATCKKLGTETVNGRTCDKWEITPKSGKLKPFGWTRSCTSPSRSSGDITTQYTNIKEGPQDAALFKVPDGYKKMDMGGMGGRPPRPN